MRFHLKLIAPKAQKSKHFLLQVKRLVLRFLTKGRGGPGWIKIV
jgi:hypothetical protein